MSSLLLPLNPFDDVMSSDVMPSPDDIVPDDFVDGAHEDQDAADPYRPEYVKEVRLADAFRNVELTDGQRTLIPKLEAFLKTEPIGVFLLKGYAGTGKTFMMKGVVDYLTRQH